VHRFVDDRDTLGDRPERAIDGGAEPILEHERDEVFLRSRVEEQRALGDAGVLRHLRGRGAVEPALGEQRRRGLPDARELVVLVLLAAHESDSGHL
jgi:hypothetical protein